MISRMFSKFGKGLGIVLFIPILICCIALLLAASILSGILVGGPIGFCLHLAFGWNGLLIMSIIFYIVAGVTFITGIMKIFEFGRD